ncbi:MAG: carboxymuconolactone decarboxylase family protein [Hyphomicrobium sp.]|jgi:uncharacterized peroxidase-related enzyme
MQRIKAIDPVTATDDVKVTLDAVKAKLGGVPNIFRTMAVAPSVLNGYLAFSDATEKGRLSGKLRERIALATANINGCDYCASAHQALGKMAGLSPEEIGAALRGQSDDAKVAAALTFAKAVLADRGQVSDDALKAVRAAGWSDGEILEIVASVVLNILTNYLNNVAGTEVDFPRVTTHRAA